MQSFVEGFFLSSLSERAALLVEYVLHNKSHISPFRITAK